DATSAGLESRYKEAMRQAVAAHDQLASASDPHAGLYLLPLAFRKRTLFKMDFAEAVYIAELRTTEAGHHSYRQVAYAMFQEVAHKHPSLAEYFRVPDMSEQPDLLKR